MSEYEDKVEQVQKAEEVLDLLEHLGWQQVLKPEIDKQLTYWTHALPAIVLNSKKEEDLGYTKEELAGRIAGMQYAVAVIEDVLKKGSRAFKALNPAT